MKKLFLICSLVLVLALSACGGNAPAEPAPAAPEEMPAEKPAEEAPAAEPAAPTETPEPTAEPEPAFDPQPADGQRVEFQAEDGTNLVGYYYPLPCPMPLSWC